MEEFERKLPDDYITMNNGVNKKKSSNHPWVSIKVYKVYCGLQASL